MATIAHYVSQFKLKEWNVLVFYNGKEHSGSLQKAGCQSLAITLEFDGLSILKINPYENH